MKYFALKQQRNSKVQECKLIADQIRLLYSEIELRNKLKDDLLKRMKVLYDEAQDISDQLLETEERMCIHHKPLDLV